MLLLSQYSDAELERIFCPLGFDGRWGSQTKSLIGTDKALPLKLDINWVITAAGFHCPICNRDKANLFVRANSFFLASLSVHHDHLTEFVGLSSARFDPVIICLACNNIDARVKRKFRDIHPAFSFDPDSLKKLILRVGRTKHEVDYALAYEIWQDWRQQYLPRLLQGNRKKVSYHMRLLEDAKRRFFRAPGPNEPLAFSAFIERSRSQALDLVPR